MRYIEKVEIENYQCHKKSTLELSPHINLIVGSSESGKSATLRAINWVLHNQPKSLSFLTRGEEQCKVTLLFNDGVSVSRIKSKQRNAVVLVNADGQESVFEKIGHDLPEEVVRALGNPPIDERHGPISYARQMDSLFLTSLSPTDLPRSISELTGIDDFEEAASILSKQSRAAERQVREGRERVEGHESDLTQYADLDGKLEQLTAIEKDECEANRIIDIITAIDNVLTQYKVVITTGNQTFEKLKLASSISGFIEDIEACRRIKDIIEELDHFTKNYHWTVQQETRMQEMMSESELLSGEDLLDCITRCKGMSATIGNIDVFQTNYDKLMNKGRSIKDLYDTWMVKHNNLLQERTELIVFMKENGFWCDACDRPLPAAQQCEVHNVS